MTVGVNWRYPLRWSWLHWWEANRDPYLMPIRQGMADQSDQLQEPDGEPADDPASRQLLKATAALTRALADDDGRVRASAAFSLGQMEAVQAVDAIDRLTRDDGNRNAGNTGYVALGLLDSTESEEALRQGEIADQVQGIARLTGLGLMTLPAQGTLQDFQRMAGHTDPVFATAAVWAIRQNPDPANDRTFTALLNHSDSPWLASEAILGLGRPGNNKAVADLADILLATPRGRKLPAYEALRLRQQERQRIAENLRAELERKAGTPAQEYDKAYERYLRLNADWVKKSGAFFQRRGQSLPTPSPPARLREAQAFTLVLGDEYIYQSRLRAAAAVALGYIDHPRAVQALLTSLQQDGDEFEGLYEDLSAVRWVHKFSHLHKAMALMSLGRIGDDRAVSVLIDTLSGRIVTKVNLEPAVLFESPLRGHAALALGLYAQPKMTPQGAVDRPRYEAVCQVLAETAANPVETAEVRSAAMLALGLTRRTENLRYLQQISEAVQPAQDPLLSGYLLLARGMLADRNIIAPAKALLESPDPTESMSGVLGRRAAVLGLGVLGVQEVIPILNAAWHQSYYVNRETALAYSLCDAYSATDPLVKLLETSDKPLARAFAARCLGDLFTRERPTRAARLINGTNYAMRNDRIIPFQALANEFLYYGLIPAFGEVWP